MYLKIQKVDLDEIFWEFTLFILFCHTCRVGTKFFFAKKSLLLDDTVDVLDIKTFKYDQPLENLISPPLFHFHPHTHTHTHRKRPEAWPHHPRYQTAYHTPASRGFTNTRIRVCVCDCVQTKHFFFFLILSVWVFVVLRIFFLPCGKFSGKIWVSV